MVAADGERVAVAAETRGKGVVVVMNDEINAAREVTKTNTYRVQTFRSRDIGLIGYADPDRVVYYRAPLRRHTATSEFNLAGVERMPLVDELYVHAGCRSGLAEAALLRHPALRVVLTSGYVGDTGRAGTSFVPKPWQPDRLRALIEDAAPGAVEAGAIGAMAGAQLAAAAAARAALLGAQGWDGAA